MTKIFACRPSRSSDQSFNSSGLRVPFGLTTSSGLRPSLTAFSTRAKYLALLVWNALSRSTISPASSMMAGLGCSCSSVTWAHLPTCASFSVGRDEKRYPRSGGTPPVWANNLLTICQLPAMRDSER